MLQFKCYMDSDNGLIIMLHLLSFKVLCHRFRVQPV